MLLLRGAREYNLRRDFVYSTVCEVIFFVWWWAEKKASWGAGFAGVGFWWGWRLWARVVPCPFWWWGLFGDEAVGEEAVVLVVADNEVIEEVAGLDEFGVYFIVGSAGYGIAGWVVADVHDGVCVGEEGAFLAVVAGGC
jgi:hypothetical protein